MPLHQTKGTCNGFKENDAFFNVFLSGQQNLQKCLYSIDVSMSIEGDSENDLFEQNSSLEK